MRAVAMSSVLGAEVLTVDKLLYENSASLKRFVGTFDRVSFAIEEALSV